jgi:FixJ family two-component response regulator
MPRATKVWLTAEQQDDFERFARSRTLAARLVQRAQIVLQAAAGKADFEIAQALDITRQTAGLWRRRFLASRLYLLPVPAFRQ